MEYTNYSDEQLVANAGAGQGASLEMMRRLKDSIGKLNASVNTFNDSTTKQQNIMIELAQESGKQAEQMLRMTRRITRLTWAIALLTTISCY